MNNQPKINLGEAYFLIAFALIADFINMFPLFNWLVTVITLPAYQFYFRMKGIKGTYSLVGNLIELVPVLSILPALTTVVVATIIITNHPKLVQVGLQAAGAAVPGAGGLAAKAATAVLGGKTPLAK